ncbi:MAG TPA: hypothetical protein VF665_06080, partial [Longimicrobium sp.]|uniref:esterase/lipase family protein n=1 Tax=Longimicrobium sp. TaxID=2029185 RepID=UPI002ED9E197
MPNPVVLIHGYSDSGKGFEPWRKILTDSGRSVTDVHTCNYETLTNEVSLSDLAEAFDRALRLETSLREGQPFDAIVHSTGMLVIRAWLAMYAHRRERLKRLVALAPATFGSPLAHRGRSWVGAIFKGRRQLGPDFLEAGDRVLDALELGSRITWDLAHRDLVGEGHRCYGADGDTPYVFVFCGTRGYRGAASVANTPGADGTVRWAGTPLNTRKIVLDLTREQGTEERFRVAPFTNLDIPLIPVEGLDHGTILSEPTPDLRRMVLDALQVDSAESLAAWHASEAVRRAVAHRESGRMPRFQQFVVRVMDERGDPVPDYNIQMLTYDARGREKEIRAFMDDVHTYEGDKSFRSFHVNLDEVKPETLPNLWMRVIASSGSRLVGYHGIGSEKIDPSGTLRDADGKWDARVDVSAVLGTDPAGLPPGAAQALRETRLFYPFTTTLLEIRLNREPLPLGGDQPNHVLW